MRHHGLLGGDGEIAFDRRPRDNRVDEDDWSFLPEAAQGLRQGFDSPASFWAALGKPESEDGYALPERWQGEGIPEDVAAKVNAILDGDRQEFMSLCHHCNLTGKQAEALFGRVGGILAGCVGRENAEQRSPEEVLRELWPKDTRKNLDAARRGAQYAGLGDALDAAGLSGNPLVLTLAKLLGEAIGESGAPGERGYRAGLPVGDQAREEMYRLIASEAYRKNDPTALRKLEALSRRVDLR